MSCRSAIYCTVSGVQVPANGQIPMGSVVRRFGPSLSLDGFGVTADECGYYAIDTVVTLVPEAAGNIGVQLYANGSPVQGAVATGVGADGSPITLPIVGMVRQRCCGATVFTLNLVSPDAATTGALVQSGATRIEKL